MRHRTPQLWRWRDAAAGGPPPVPLPAPPPARRDPPPGPAAGRDPGGGGRQPPPPPPEWAEDAAVLVAGGAAAAGSARQAARAARRARAGHRRAVLAARQAHAARERGQRQAHPYLPPGGETGPSAGRTWRRLRLEAHQATTDVLAGAYPFLAEEGLGSAGMLIGQDAWSGGMFCYDPWVLYTRGVLTSPNITLAGQIGRGKSALAKSLAARAVAFGRRVYVPGDPKGEWAPVARALGGQVIALGPGRPARLNPLDEGPRPAGAGDGTWRAQVTARRLGLLAALTEAVLGRPLAATERTAVDAALSAAQAAAPVPVLPQVVDALLDPRRDAPGSTIAQLRADGRDAGHALARLVRGDLAGLFDGPSTVTFDPGVPVLALDLSGVSGSDMLLSLVMTCASTWMEAALADPAGGQRLVVYDEAWRIIAQPALLARMQAQWKLSRAWGLANMMIIHRVSDLDAAGDAGSAARGLAQGLLADTGTRILYAQPHEEAAAAARLLGLTGTEAGELASLATGEGLWRIGDRAFIVRHIATPGELAVYDTSTRMTGTAPPAPAGGGPGPAAGVAAAASASYGTRAGYAGPPAGAGWETGGPAPPGPAL
jgi:hypothetical protein